MVDEELREEMEIQMSVSALQLKTEMGSIDCLRWIADMSRFMKN